ncbi:uncharacterized protein LOC120815997 isoform X2 [Gasterosteus aculeatus]|nr:junctional sarcoplasmic reticulum protein 1 isoform X2 [Gasterosteus aculeatus aculeatus]
MSTTRKFKEEIPTFSQPVRAEPKILLREPSLPRTTLRKASSIQNLTQIETPWENVTLNRCLFVAISILVVTSGFQKLHESLRGQRAAEEEDVGLTVRRTGRLRHSRPPPEPETTLWEVMSQWLPDLDDEEDEEDDDADEGGGKVKKSKRGATARASRGLRNKPPPDRKSIKRREGTFKEGRAKKEIKDKTYRNKKKEPEAGPGEEDEDDGEPEEESGSQRLDGKKEKRKTQKA